MNLSLYKRHEFINDIIGRYASCESGKNLEVWNEETRELVQFLDSIGPGRLSSSGNYYLICIQVKIKIVIVENEYGTR